MGSKFFLEQPHCMLKLEGSVAQSVECATTGEEVVGLIPAVAACAILVGLVSV